MSIKNNTTSLQEVLDILATKASGVNPTDATAVADEIFQGKTAYTSEGKVTGTFTIDEELTTQDNLITEIQNAVDNLPEATQDLVLQNKTVTPTTSSQTIVADNGYDGLNSVTVNGDINLVAENIVSGKSIFGVMGNASSGDENSACNLTITIGEYVDLCDCLYSSEGQGVYVAVSSNEGTTITFNNVDTNQFFIVYGFGVYDNLFFTHSEDIQFINEFTTSGYYFFKIIGKNSAINLHIYSKD